MVIYMVPASAILFNNANQWYKIFIPKVQMHDVVANIPGGLYSEVGESGKNFSAGQRQLLCLCRAFLKRNNIIMIDEATANVDLR